ncbi:hypothetical protein [Aequorivita echinoideorum]|uniref:Lactonase, 7-bladed beta-propeller n=1 Tax=Aequorivita echinoideorum TaxID=1549647 RepID=A0ABS5S6D3_9FLAO|nr:hypothetical protein [Aequorivita echinoideorum]MBT0607995.1 hypothetical protein [Aequorivita echinoideorum]
MKKLKFVFPLVALTLGVACSNDDDNSGTDDGPIPTVINANLFATSNLNDNVISFDFTPNGIATRTFSTSSNDNEGVYFDDDDNELFVVSRSQGVINTYSNIDNLQSGEISPFLSSSSVLDSPRDIDRNNDLYVVADNTDLDGNPDTGEGRFFVFSRNNEGYTLRNTVTVDYAVWGIEFIGNDLYTVVDKTSDVAVLRNFLTTYTTDVTAVPDKRITIEGIARTHGIAEDDGFVILTDIGDADISTDGGLHFISNFVSKFNSVENGGTLAVAGNQVRVSGNLTELGNPVSVAYDNGRNTIMVAERANEGGKILFFTNVEAGGNLRPSLSTPFEGASSVYFEDR